MNNNKKDTLYFLGTALIKEKTEGLWGVKLLYVCWYGWLFRYFVTRRWVSAFIGWLYTRKGSAKKIEPFIKKHSILIQDFVVPKAGYTSFNDFFIRKLKPGARNISSDLDSCISPADSKIFVFPEIHESMTFFIKELPFNLPQFLSSDEMAQKYSKGSMAIFRLAPYDYHRFHFPVSGVVGNPIWIDGGYESVNPAVYKAGIQPLVTNKRIIIPLHNEQFGTILMVPVGALFVGSIVLTAKTGSAVKKGDEAGCFQFGGSTVVLIAQPGSMTYKKLFVEHAQKGYETAVVVGDPVASVIMSKELL